MYLYRPLLRVTDKLLAIGLLTDKDLDQLLCLIDPANFDNGYYSGTQITLSATDGAVQFIATMHIIILKL